MPQYIPNGACMNITKSLAYSYYSKLIREKRELFFESIELISLGAIDSQQ